MTLNFCDGFDHYSTTADLLAKWGKSPGGYTATDPYFTGSGAAIGATYSRGASGNGLLLPSGCALAVSEAPLGIVNETNYKNLNIKRTSNSTRLLFSAFETGTACWQLYWNANGKFELFNAAGSSLGESSVLANDTNWHSLEVTLSENDGQFDLVIDGTAFSWSGTIINPGFSTYFCLGGTTTTASTGTDFYIDDYTVWSYTRHSGIVNNGFSYKVKNLASVSSRTDAPYSVYTYQAPDVGPIPRSVSVQVSLHVQPYTSTNPNVSRIQSATYISGSINLGTLGHVDWSFNTFQWGAVYWFGPITSTDWANYEWANYIDNAPGSGPGWVKGSWDNQIVEAVYEFYDPAQNGWRMGVLAFN